jgi:hypothetical protein
MKAFSIDLTDTLKATAYKRDHDWCDNIYVELRNTENDTVICLEEDELHKVVSLVKELAVT